MISYTHTKPCDLSKLIKLLKALKIHEILEKLRIKKVGIVQTRTSRNFVTIKLRVKPHTLEGKFTQMTIFERLNLASKQPRTPYSQVIAICSTIKLSVTGFLLSLSSIAYADTMMDVLDLAKKNDPVIRAAEATYQAERTIKARARAQLLPSIDASYSYGETDGNSHNGSTAVIENREVPLGSRRKTDSSNEAVAITLNQNLFNLQAFFGYRQSLAVASQAELTYASAEQDLLIRVADAYLNVLRQQTNLEAAKAEEKAINRQLEQAQERYDVGLIAITEVHEAQAAYDLSTAQTITAEVSLDIAHEQLSSITGSAHPSIQDLNSDFPVIPPSPKSIDEWIAFTETNNLNILIAEEVLAAANQNARVVKSRSLPTVTGKLTYNKSHGDTSGFTNGIPFPEDEFSDAESTGWEIRAEMPLFTGGERTAEIKEAGKQRVARQANLVAEKRSAVTSTRSNYLTTVADMQRVKARNRAIISAKSALESTEAGYDAGTRNIVDVLNSQRDLYRAERDYANSRYDYILNLLRLKQSAGLLTDADIQSISQWLTVESVVSAPITSNLNYANGS